MGQQLADGQIFRPSFHAQIICDPDILVSLHVSKETHQMHHIVRLGRCMNVRPGLRLEEASGQ